MMALFLAACLAGLCLIIIWASNSGRKSQQADDAKAIIEAGKRVTDAQADAPANLSELRERLRKPGGGL